MGLTRLSPLFIAIAALLLLCNGATGDDWPHWRGPERNGSTPERLGIQPGETARLVRVWTKRVGEGCGSVVVWQGRVYATGWRDGTETVFCLSAQDGSTVWSQGYPSPKYGRHAVGDQEWYSGPTATPTVDPDSGCLYTLGCDGDLICWDAGNGGARVWHINLYDSFKAGRRPLTGGNQTDYGYTTAPLVDGTRLLVAVGGQAGLLVALDKRTGRTLWASEVMDYASNCGGISPISVDGVPCAAVLSLERLVIVRLDAGNEGRTLAAYPWKTDYANNLVTPTAVGSRVFLSSAYNLSRSVLIEMRGGEPVVVWQSRVFSGVGSPAVWNNRLYVAYREVVCLNGENGTVVWKGPRSGEDGSCVVTGDGHLIVFGNGTLVVGDISGESGFREVCRQEGLCRPYEGWPHVVLAAGRIICKDRFGVITAFRIERTRQER